MTLIRRIVTDQIRVHPSNPFKPWSIVIVLFRHSDHEVLGSYLTSSYNAAATASSILAAA